jgi:hypothetical protein
MSKENAELAVKVLPCPWCSRSHALRDPHEVNGALFGRCYRALSPVGGEG